MSTARPTSTAAAPRPGSIRTSWSSLKSPSPSKDDALAYLNDLGLTRIVDAAIGSVILVTPSDPKTGFTARDQKYYYALQTAILAQKASETVNKVTTFYSDAEYFGGSGNTYVVGIDGGATFLNNYVASTFDYVSRLAGMLLINGKMDNIRQVATFVPAYLVNAPDAVIEKYKKADDTDASMSASGMETFFNQALPLKKVVVARDANADAAKYIQDAYSNLFKKAQRVRRHQGRPLHRLHSLPGRQRRPGALFPLPQKHRYQRRQPKTASMSSTSQTSASATSRPRTANTCRPGLSSFPMKSSTAPLRPEPYR